MNRNFLTGLIVGVLVSMLLFGSLSSSAKAKAEEDGEEDATEQTPKEKDTKKETKNKEESKPKKEEGKHKKEEAKKDGKEEKTAKKEAGKTGTDAKKVEQTGPAYHGIKSLDELDEDVDENAQDKNIKIVYKTPESCKEFTLYLDDKASKIDKRERDLQQQEKMIALMQQSFDALNKQYSDTEARIKKVVQYDPSNLKDNPQLIEMAHLYETFTPEDAASRLQNLDLDLTLAILKAMKPKVVGKILTAMDAKLSAALSSQMVRGF